MKSSDFQEILRIALENAAIEEYCDSIDYVRTYDDVGMLTTDKGLVIRMVDGSEFQITIVKTYSSTISDNDEEDEDEENN